MSSVDDGMSEQNPVGPSDAGEAPDAAPAARLSMRVVLQGFRRDPVSALAIGFLMTLIVSVIAADLILAFDPYTQNLRGRFLPPLTRSGVDGPLHLLGTDSLGRDVLARILHGGRVSMTVGVLSALLSGTFGVTVGLIAGFYRGAIDSFLSRCVDVMIGFPTYLAAIFILFLIGPGFWNLVLVLAVIRWHLYARVTRGLTMSLRESPFVEGAQAIGVSDIRIILRHLLPNLASPILVLVTLEVGVVIIAEAGLSFLGFGILPPTPSWGIEIAGSREYLRDAWWLVTFPGLAIFMTTLSLNLTATWVHTISDPIQRWRWVVAGRASVAATSEEDL